MNTNLKLLLMTLPSVAALALILMQQSRVSTLEKQVAAQASEPTATLSSNQSPVPPATDGASKAVIAGLETRISELDRKLTATAMLARTATRTVAAASPKTLAVAADDSELPDMIDEVASLRADVDALLQGRGVETPEGRKTIRDEVATARTEARAERVIRRTERREQWLNTFAEDNGLSETQSTALMAAEDSFRERRLALREAVRGGEKNRTEVQTEIRAAREEMNATLKESLGDDLFNALETSRSDRRPGRRNGDRPVPRPSE
ncbi:MAG: hypothetical protein ACI9MR_002626 [Myxococcota bacterium]|jgi:hypothetical protein